MSMRRRFRARTEQLATDLLEVPKDTLQQITRTTSIGNMQLIVESYEEVLEFSDDHVLVSAIRGQIMIRGTHLTIKMIVPEQLVVEGLILGIDFTGQ